MSVLVIEAGPVDPGLDGILVPGAFAPYYYFWPGLQTVPQTGLNNRTIPAITAQVVGGGSTINAMVYLRCVYKKKKETFLTAEKPMLTCSGVM